ncbi:MAG: hypothetical protein M3348_16950 [Acidobacteriota bacterium]|nr:hypothetical protein [Acidobacteriota bacterium]
MGNSNFKTVFTWAVGIGFVLYIAFLFIWLTKLGVDPEIMTIFLKQWLAVIVFPSACFAALVVVMLLDRAAGDIEFSGLGFTFKGAAAPLVMWALLIIVMAVSLNLLWQHDGGQQTDNPNSPAAANNNH